MPIQILADEVASQIAAGEVIERPASVIKELVENALDARAREVVIHVEAAGKRLVQVVDDGEGIPPGEIHLTVARHATSKLRLAEDLFHICSLGFRGEALASIASVSRLILSSRQESSPAGVRLLVDGGKMAKLESTGMPVGTDVRVEDLFYNVPARLKFLKHDITERQHMDGLVTRYAMAYPEVRFQFFSEGHEILRTSGNGDRREALVNLYGIETARQLLEVSFEDGFISVSGFISPVSLTRANRREITFFVNGRWIQDVPLASALLQAYHTLLMVGRFPMAALFLKVAPEEVDVNVHPAKAEVRFQHPDRVFSAVQRAVRRALLASSPVPQVSFPTWGMVEPQRRIDPAWEMASGNPAETLGDAPPALPSELGAAQATTPALVSDLPLLRLVGQVGAAYLVAEGPDGLYLIDQHAAHERVLFEKYCQLQALSRVPSQNLLEGVPFQVSRIQENVLSGQLDLLGQIGFDVEEFGPGTFRILAIPSFLTRMDPTAALRVVLEDFEEDETPLQAEKEKRLIARICKRAAVKAGQVLSLEEQKSLLQDLENCQSPRTCPHGRPTMIHLSVDLLERQFGRRGSL